MRQIVLDTETTGLELGLDHRIIEIGCVELINRRHTGRNFHRYLCPDREIDYGARNVHGITNEFLVNQPRFAEIAEEFLQFVAGAELVIHNAPFDVGFLDMELRRLEGTRSPMNALCKVLDTLVLARQMHPGQRNSLDALCKRYCDRQLASRAAWGAARCAHPRGRVPRNDGWAGRPDPGWSRDAGQIRVQPIPRAVRAEVPLLIVRASAEEIEAHERFLRTIDQVSGGVGARF